MNIPENTELITKSESLIKESLFTIHKLHGKQLLSEQSILTALRHLTLANQINPKDEETRLFIIQAQINLKKYDQAKLLLDALLKKNPKNTDAWLFLHLLAYLNNHPQEALQYAMHTHKLEPKNKKIIEYMAYFLLLTKNWSMALDWHQKHAAILSEDPEYPFVVGYIYLQQKNYDLAAKQFQLTLLKNRVRPQYLLFYGLCKFWQSKIISALILWIKALFVWTKNRMPATKKSPEMMPLFFNKTTPVFDLAASEKQLCVQITQIISQPKNKQKSRAQKHHIFGTVLNLLQQYELALKNFDMSLHFQPNNAAVLAEQFSVKQIICNWDHYHTDLQLLLKSIIQEFKTTRKQPISAHSLLSLPGMESTQLRWITAQMSAMEEIVAPMKKKLYFQHKITTQPRLRIGYLSGNFQSHPTGLLLQDFFKHHNRKRYEIFLYSYGADEKSVLREKIKSSSEHFIDFAYLKTDECARRIYNDGIQILIDLQYLTNYTADRHQEQKQLIPALRPAPIQVNFHAFAGTSGATYQDYIIANPTLIPQTSERYFQEKCAHLPIDIFTTSYKETYPNIPITTRKKQSLPENGFIFCCFNNAYKITPHIFDLWMQILKQVPQSILWLQLINEDMKKNILLTAAKYHITEPRIQFAKKMPCFEDHLSRLALANLFLDTPIYNAHTTAIDALWAGVPVLTCPGNTFAGRVAASILKSLDLPELIAKNENSYVAKAIELATNKEQYQILQTRLDKNKWTHPPFNVPLLIKYLENAYEKMWEIYQSGSPPQRFELPRL